MPTIAPPGRNGPASGRGSSTATPMGTHNPSQLLSPLHRSAMDTSASSPNSSTAAGGGGTTGAASSMHSGSARSAGSTQQQQASSPHGSSNNKNKKYPSDDQLVLDFLKKRGMDQAAIDLSHKLDERIAKDQGQNLAEIERSKNPRQKFLEEEEKMRASRTLLAKTTGGGFGYDRDSAWPVVQWGIPDTESNVVAETDINKKHKNLGIEEARSFLDSFIHFQLWVLNLPNQGESSSDADYENVILQRTLENPIVRGQQAIQENKNMTLSDLMKALVGKPSTLPEADKTKMNLGVYSVPPSTKSELLSVSFALFVHTYSDLLEVGMELVAQKFRDAFAPVYQELYPDEFRDLTQCTSSEDMMRLNTHNSQHMEAVGNLKTILVQVASYQLRKDEYLAQMQSNPALSKGRTQEQLLNDPKVKDCDKKIQLLQSKYKEMSQRATQWFERMHDLPFLRRARATRWILTLSTSTYAMLSSFLGSGDDALLPMSTLLQTKCTLQVERRDPLPYTPSFVLADSAEIEKMFLSFDHESLNWSMPVPKQKLVYGEEMSGLNKSNTSLPKILVNGFRRLEHLERKRDTDVLTRSAQKRARYVEEFDCKPANPLEPSILISTLPAGYNMNHSSSASTKKKNSTWLTSRGTGGNATTIWEEPGVSLCCAKPCNFGKRIAAGCDDGTVRLYSMGKETGPSHQILTGHNNRYPVFCADWNKDGRSLLTAGGDGSVRLWDTSYATTPVEAPFLSRSGSKVSSPSKSKSMKASQSAVLNPMSGNANSDSLAYSNGAAIGVYNGHLPNSPVWSVAFSPSGYYFCSAGADACARLWTTDRTNPVRLFSGHLSPNVNCVAWHPNANYIVTGSDDKTARLWDIQTGQTVRILSGSSAGVNAIRISPDGKCCAGADYSGTVHLWHLGTGRKMSVYRSASTTNSLPEHFLNTLSFSACGGALAVGGDDCAIKLWDIRKAPMPEKDASIRTSPFKSFPTRRTTIMDLQYTSRNLLLAVGRSIAPVPLVSSSD